MTEPDRADRPDKERESKKNDMELLKKLSVMCMAVMAMTVLASCDDIFTSDDEPIGMNYNKALAGKWRVARAGYIQNRSGEKVHVDKSLTLPTSIESIEFANGMIHLNFSETVTLDRVQFGGTQDYSVEITGYSCVCDPDGEGFLNFEFGFATDDGTTCHEIFREWTNVEHYFPIILWAYGKKESYATTLILACNDDNSSEYGYELERY